MRNVVGRTDMCQSSTRQLEAELCSVRYLKERTENVSVHMTEWIELSQQQVSAAGIVDHEGVVKKAYGPQGLQHEHWIQWKCSLNKLDLQRTAPTKPKILSSYCIDGDHFCFTCWWLQGWKKTQKGWTTKEPLLTNSQLFDKFSMVKNKNAYPDILQNVYHTSMVYVLTL